jgi:alpha-tubulin suppressor-like RCC1 family protein
LEGLSLGDSGQLGERGEITNTRPIAISGLSNVVAVSAGMDHSLALKSDATVWSWGGNQYGQLGRDTLTASPAPVSGLSNALAVAAGGGFSLALTDDGSLWAWGNNERGQLGNGVSFTITNLSLRTNFFTEVVYFTVTNTHFRSIGFSSSAHKSDFTYCVLHGVTASEPDKTASDNSSTADR